MIDVLLRKLNVYLSEKIKGLFQLYLFEYGRLCKNLRVGIKLYRIIRVYVFYYKFYFWFFLLVKLSLGVVEEFRDFGVEENYFNI